MPDTEYYAMTEDTAFALRDLLERQGLLSLDGTYKNDRKYNRGYRGPLSHVRITSTTLTAGRYPGKVLDFNPDTNAFSDFADCWVVSLNGTVLALSTNYEAQRKGPASDGKLVYCVKLDSGAAGTALSVQEFISGGATGTTYDPVLRILLPNDRGLTFTYNATTDFLQIDIALAGATTTGMVTNVAQTLAGVKTFTSQVIVNQGGSSNYIWIQQNIGGVDTKAIVQNLSFGDTGYFAFESVADSLGATGSWGVGISMIANSAIRKMIIDSTHASTFQLWIAGVSGGTPGSYQGVSGTFSSPTSITVVNGIVTAVS